MATVADITPHFPNRKYEKGERVVYTERFNNPGYMKPGDKIAGTVFNVFTGPAQPPTYRIELDIFWRDGLPGSKGKRIKVGNVYGDSLSPIPK